MKGTFKVLAAVGLASVASSGYAAINNDNSQGGPAAGDLSGELFISVLRQGSEGVSPVSSLFDTGVTAAQLLSGSVANGTVLANVGGLFSTAPLSSFVFNGGLVMNGSNIGQYGAMITSNNTSGMLALQSNGQSFWNNVQVNMDTFLLEVYGGVRNTNFANNDDFLNIAPPAAGQPGNGFHNSFYWGSSIGGQLSESVSTEGGLDSPLTLYSFGINEDFSSFTATVIGYLTANSTTGNIVFNTSVTPEVPLPAAVWLMGSGLAGLLGFGRRRRVTVA